jgi:beta-N-acetylhexosaminidase
MRKPKAVIFGLAGESLTPEETAFFQQHQPLGFILFARNCKTPEQIKALNASLRAITGRKETPILIDQEGGRVARLGPPQWRKVPAACNFVELTQRDQAKGCEATYLNARLMAKDLIELGINVDCAPTADLLIPGCHDIIGDRAHGDTPEMVSLLAAEVCRGLMEGGVLPVIKHIPGHGRAKADSHESLPVVDAPLDELARTDFVPFKNLSEAPWAMTAHITYTAIDTENPATLSNKVVRIIREEIGFDGLLLTDDLSMKALTGTFEERTKKSLAAGCDVVLHCNGKMEEMQPIAEACPPMTDKAMARFERSMRRVRIKELPENQNLAALEALLQNPRKTA